MDNRSSLGLVVEGPYDKSIFAQLVPRMLSEATPKLVILPTLGVKNLEHDLLTLLRNLEHFLAGQAVDKAMVIRDTGGRALQEVEDDLAERAARHQFRFPREVQFCGVRQEIEAWLLADEEGITRVAHDRGVDSRPATRVNEALEEIVHAKERLQASLSRCGLPYTDTVCGEIAAELDLDRLRYRCPSFGRFEMKLHDC